MTFSMSLGYLKHIQIENISINTISLCFLIFGLVEFFLSKAVYGLGRKACDFFSQSWSSAKSKPSFSDDSRVRDGNKSRDFELSDKQASVTEKVKEDGSMTGIEAEMVMSRLGIFGQPEGTKLQDRFSSRELVDMFEEEEPCLDEVQAAFNVFDENKDGFIDDRDIQRVLCALGLNEGLEIENCRRMIRTFDENGDQRIDFQEFVEVLSFD